MWAGTDACEPVTWQECKLVPKEVKFIVPEMTCQEKQELWYHEPEQVEEVEIEIEATNFQVTETRVTNVFSCSVESTVACSVKSRPSCKEITWTECRFFSSEICKIYAEICRNMQEYADIYADIYM